MSPVPSSQPFLSLAGAAFRLGDRLVFKNTSWTFRHHEHWAIVGPNGGGKSLFAEALRGRLPLVRGELTYHFRPPTGLSAEEAIGHVAFEDRKADLHDTVVQSRWNSLEEEGTLLVRDFLAYDRVMEVNPFEVTDRHALAQRGFASRQQQAIAQLRLAPLLERTLLSLSNGERQRVQLARALCRPLRLLVLDEPFAGLDTATRDSFHRLLERLMDSPLRVLLITTRPEDLPRHITHLVRVQDCRIVAAGPRRKHFSTGSADAPAGLQPTGLGGRHHNTPARTPALPALTVPRTSLVELREVTIRYGNITILNRVSWTLRAGESWALLGPNGSGKTTLLSLILGDHPQAYSNDVRVFGKPRTAGESIWSLKRQIGWVSPELHLHFDDTVSCLDVVASGFHDSIGLFEKATHRQRAAAQARLAQFRLLEWANWPLYGLSLGLQRMVLLARALVKDPPLLILDEPCQGLDSSHRALFVNAVDALIRAGRTTVVYVTHRDDEIPPSIHRVLRLPVGHVSSRPQRLSPRRS